MIDLRREAVRFSREAGKIQKELEKLKRENKKLKEQIEKLRMAQILGLKKNKSLEAKDRTSICFDEEVLKRIRKLAFDRGKTVSSIVNEFCKQALKNEQKQ